MLRVLCIVLVLVALAYGQSFCMTSAGNGPGTLSAGEYVWAGYTHGYSTIHEASTIYVKAGSALKLTLTCPSTGGVVTLSVPIPSATYYWDRASSTPNMNDPNSWQPPSLDGCGTSTFQSGAVAVPTGCPTAWDVTNQQMCLTVTGSNNIDTVQWKWHYDTTPTSAGSSTDPCRAWSSVKQVVPAPICGSTDFSAVIDNPECAVGCLCFGFELISVVENTAEGTHTISFEVWNFCQQAVSFIAIGTQGLTRIAPTDGSTYTSPRGTKYNVYWMSDGGNPGFESIKFQGSTAFFQNGESDIFTITVDGWYPGYVWTLLGHRGGLYETFASVDLSGCPCPQGGDTGSNCQTPEPECPDAYKYDYNLQECSEYLCEELAPNGERWICKWGSNDWYLATVPVGAPLPAGAIELPDNTDGTDPDGYRIGCDCGRIYVDCPNNCCGAGSCARQDGTCTCEPDFSGLDCCTYNPPSTTATVQAATVGDVTTVGEVTTIADVTTIGASTTNGETVVVSTTGQVVTTGQVSTTGVVTTQAAATTVTPPPPCFNGGNFCNGNGVCNRGTGICDCYTGWEGDFCDQEIIPPSCFDYSNNCEGCLAAPADLNCAWCSSVAGEQCLPDGECANALISCQDSPVPYVPELECHNDTECNNGECVESAEGNYCQCADGERGVDCSAGGLSDLAKALAISGGVIAVIVIGGVVALFLLGFGAKKGIDYLSLRETNMQNASDNPFYTPSIQEFNNPIQGQT